jgi:hypothetical protein
VTATTSPVLTTGDVARWLAAAGPFPVTRSTRTLDRGWKVTDRYVETFWLPYLGTLGFVLLRRLDSLAASSDALAAAERYEKSKGVPPLRIDPFTTSTARLCAEVGLRNESGTAGAVPRGIARLILCYGLVDLTERGVAVPTLVPFLRPDLVAVLPPHLREMHASWEARP